MKNFKIPLLTILTLVLLLFLHIHGMKNHLYLNYWFYDIIVHFIGGVCIALSTFYISNISNINYIKNNPSLIIIISFIAGVLWEVFEVRYGIAGHPFGSYLYNFDTTKDLIDDTLGSVLVFYFIYTENKKINKII